MGIVSREAFVLSEEEEIFCAYRSKVLKPRAFIVILTGDGVKGSKSKALTPLVDALLIDEFGVLVFDFIGQGDSGGERSKLNILTGVANLKDALSFFYSKLEINRLYAFATSFGGSVLLNSKGVLPKLSKIALKSPVSDLLETYENEHTRDEVTTPSAKANGFCLNDKAMP